LKLFSILNVDESAWELPIIHKLPTTGHKIPGIKYGTSFIVHIPLPIVSTSMASPGSNLNCFYVGNIGADDTDNDLKELFASQGITVESVILKCGYAFIYVAQSYSVESIQSRMRDTVLPRSGRTPRVEKSFKTKFREKDQKENPSSAVDPRRVPGKGLKRSDERKPAQEIPDAQSQIWGAAPSHDQPFRQNPFPGGM
jgi:RNA recognition motif-containing protein